MSTQPAHIAWIGLGANLGDPAGTLRLVLDELAGHPGIAAVEASGLYRTAPIDSDGPDYVNAAARLHTLLAPLALLDLLQRLEQRHGRERPYRNAPRTLDLDLLRYDDMACDTPRLVLPHPRMHQRAFVLRPLLDLDPDMTLAQGRVADLLRQCGDQGITPL